MSQRTWTSAMLPVEELHYVQLAHSVMHSYQGECVDFVHNHSLSPPINSLFTKSSYSPPWYFTVEEAKLTAAD